MIQSSEKIGIVVIGRNEGDRLKRCLLSFQGRTEITVYVDSGSTDGSVTYAKSLSVEVVELDMSIPFTMARGRNAGFKRLMELDANIKLVQFLDGDCEVARGYLDAAIQAMRAHPDITVVTGRRIERYPNASIYNRLCNIEWGRELGEIQSCGGDMMVRGEAFERAGMFNCGMIAGEEPELCVRLRRMGGKIVRIDHDMTLHDADMRSFWQWWKRSVRAGHACAEGAAMHGRSAERHKVHNLRSTLFWGAAAPVAASSLAVAALWAPWFATGLVLIMGGYGFLGIRVHYSMRRRGFNASDASLYAFFCVLGKFPNLVGVLQYWLNRLTGRQSTLIEYKPVK